MVAVKNKCQNTIMQLLEHPTSNSGSSKSNFFGNALVVASTLASQFIRQELNDGLHGNSKHDRSQVTLFSWAAQYGYVAVVQLLIEEGADVNAKDGGERTALHWAAKNGHEAVARLLIEKGANVNVMDGDRRTALHWAAENGHEAVARLLIEKWADVNAEDSGMDGSGGTALHRAAENGHEAVAKLLTRLTPPTLDS
jgi:ankyrin repeat protein